MVQLLDMAGLSNHEEAPQESKPYTLYRIMPYNRDVEETFNTLRSAMNPFNAEGTDNMSCALGIYVIS